MGDNGWTKNARDHRWAMGPVGGSQVSLMSSAKQQSQDKVEGGPGAGVSTGLSIILPAGGFGWSPRSGGPRVLAARAPHRALSGHHLVQPPGDPRNLLLLAHHHLGGGGLLQLSRPARPRPPPPRCAVQTSPGGPRAAQLKKKKKSPPSGLQLPDDCVARGARPAGKDSSSLRPPHTPSESWGEGGA